MLGAQLGLQEGAGRKVRGQRETPKQGAHSAPRPSELLGKRGIVFIVKGERCDLMEEGIKGLKLGVYVLLLVVYVFFRRGVRVDGLWD